MAVWFAGTSEPLRADALAVAAMCSEQSASIIPLLALALFIGYQIEVEPIDNSQTVCQRWYDYQGRGEDGRAKWSYEKECWDE